MLFPRRHSTFFNPILAGRPAMFGRTFGSWAPVPGRLFPLDNRYIKAEKEGL
jgi:hypothetical protein